MKKYSKAVPAIIALLALVAGAWFSAPGATAFAQSPTGTVTPSAGGGTAVSETPTAAASAQPGATTTVSPTLQFPTGASANERQLLETLYSYNPDVTAVTSAGFSQPDRTALDILWAQNASGLQMLRIAMSRARSAPVRELVRLMYQMHLKDQALLDRFEGQVSICAAGGAAKESSSASNGSTGNGAVNGAVSGEGSGTDGDTENETATPTAAATTTPACPSGSYKPGNMGASGAALSLTSVPVLPGSPLGALGFQTVNLSAAFMAPINRAPAGQFDQAFLPQMMAAHSFAIETAQSVQATAADSALRDLASHMAQEETIHHLLMMQLADRLIYGQNLGIRFPSVTPGTGQTPTTVPSATESVTPAISETATAPASTGTPVPAQPTTGAGGSTETPSAATATPSP